MFIADCKFEKKRLLVDLKYSTPGSQDLRLLGAFSFPSFDAIPFPNNKHLTFLPLAFHEPPLWKAEDILERFQNIIKHNLAQIDLMQIMTIL